MFKKIKENKFTIIITSVVILLPYIASIILQSYMSSDIADKLSRSGATNIYLMFTMLFFHLLCICICFWDKGNHDQTKKATLLTMWILPITSVWTNIVMYCSAFNMNIGQSLFLNIFMGVLFMLVGNYMPKIKRNSTLGIKIYWTLHNEENWNATHRFGGKVWFAGGLLMFLCMLLPNMANLICSSIIFASMIIIPFAYSYIYYRRQKKDGAYIKDYCTMVTHSKKLRIIVITTIILLVAVLMFTGNIDIKYGNESIKIKADFYSDISIKYSDIDSVDYLSKFNSGTRTNGFGSARLEMGNFSNDMFDDYIRYGYVHTDAAVIIKYDDEVIAISGKSNSKTKKIYNEIVKRINN